MGPCGCGKPRSPDPKGSAHLLGERIRLNTLSLRLPVPKVQSFRVNGEHWRSCKAEPAPSGKWRSPLTDASWPAAVRLGRCSCGRPSSSEAKGSAHLQGKRNSLQTLRSALRENGGHW